MMILNPSYGAFLFVPLLAALLLLLGTGIRRRSREHFYPGRTEGKAPLPGGTLLLVCGLLLAAASLIRPVSHPEENIIELKGRNIVFLVDVSRSMLAEDLVPNRLDRARFDIMSAIPSLQGNRVALVAFAGDTVLKCPLTTDYAFFRQALDDLSVNSVTRGGSSIGDAIRYVINDLYPEEEGSMDILLITDGEDQDTFPVEAAHKARDKSVRIITIAMGDEGKGTPIPDASYNNETVFSYPDLKLLRETASASRGGWMVAVESGSLRLQDILKEMKGTSGNTGSFKQISYREYYQWLLLPGFLFLAAGIFYRKRYGK